MHAGSSAAFYTKSGTGPASDLHRTSALGEPRVARARPRDGRLGSRKIGPVRPDAAWV